MPTKGHEARASLRVRADRRGDATREPTPRPATCPRPTRLAPPRQVRPARFHPFIDVTRLQSSSMEGFARMRTSTLVLVILLSTLIAVPRAQAQTPHAATQSAM